MMVSQEEIERKVLVNAADSVTGSTPLMYASIENKIQVMERLLNLGVDVNKKNKENYTALHFGGHHLNLSTHCLICYSQHVCEGRYRQLATGQESQHQHSGRTSQTILRPSCQCQEKWSGSSGR